MSGEEVAAPAEAARALRHAADVALPRDRTSRRPMTYEQVGDWLRRLAAEAERADAMSSELNVLGQRHWPVNRGDAVCGNQSCGELWPCSDAEPTP